jgi:NifB/MoaA-like Fe-S oxidoreductase
METHGTHFIHASDEWYLLAERDLPEADNYDGYIQLENGVGMLRLLLDEFYEALEQRKEEAAHRENVHENRMREFTGTHKCTIATGRLAAPFLTRMAASCMEAFPNYEIAVEPIRNDFFGEMITVSGLLTGQDVLAQLKGKDLGERLLLPCNMLRSGEEIFLDDMTLTELKTALQVEADIVKSSGQDLLDAMLFETEQHL